MTEDTNPKVSARGQAQALARQRRQAEALRANLARRKAQTRARAEDETGEGAEDGAETCPTAAPGLQDPQT